MSESKETKLLREQLAESVRIDKRREQLHRMFPCDLSLEDVRLLREILLDIEDALDEG